jgi:hypothetical protein
MTSSESRWAEGERTATRLGETAQDVASRGGAYLKDQVSGLSTRAGQVAREVDEQVRESTGKSTDAWLREGSRLVKEHPVMAVAVTLGLGYLISRMRS